MATFHPIIRNKYTKSSIALIYQDQPPYIFLILVSIFVSAYFLNIPVIFSLFSLTHISNHMFNILCVIIIIFTSFFHIFVLSSILIFLYLEFNFDVNESQFFSIFGLNVVAILSTLIYYMLVFVLFVLLCVFAFLLFWNFFTKNKHKLIFLALIYYPSEILFAIQNQHMTLKRVFIFTANHEGKSEKLKFYSEFYPPVNIDQTKFQDTLAQTHLFTQTKSYFAVIKRKNINRELSWNVDLLNRLQNVLSGKSTDLVTYIEERLFKQNILIVGTQFQAKCIRVILFQVELQEINQNPFSLMKKLMNNQHNEREQSLRNYKKREQKEREKIDEIDQLFNQLKQNDKDEATLMKQIFINVINQAKEKLIKCFGLNPNLHDPYICSSEKTTDIEKLRRQFYKIKPPAKENDSTPKPTEVQHLFGMQ